MKQFYALLSLFFITFNLDIVAQRGYYDAPYKRYEAESATLTNGTILPQSYKQSDLQSEASDQKAVTLSSTNASAEWNILESADGLVVRFSIPDGTTGSLGVYVNNNKVATLSLTSNWSWQYLSIDPNPNNNGVVNTNPKMRFDEVRLKLSQKTAIGDKFKLVRESGTITLDFAELEPVPVALSAPAGSVTYSGDGSNLQAFIDANGGKVIFLPAGIYNVNRKLWFGADNTKLMGAGMWFTQINFTYFSTTGSSTEGGLYADAVNIGFSNLYLTTVRNARSYSYKAINGVFTSGSVIENVWAEHFEAGAWIAQYFYSSTPYTDGLVVRNCRFRNNYADGINLCKGTRNTIVEHCSFRNNGDDDMAIWSADGLECINNTFRYNTSEHCWRASGCAIYGGYNNKAHHLLIKDNLEVGLRTNNHFAGVGFNANGLHELYEITIHGCGTQNDLFNQPVGAIDLACSAVNGTQVRNIKFSNIDIIDSKNNAIFFNKTGGDGFYNITFENIAINGTGTEYPNNSTNFSGTRGFGVTFGGYPSGNGSYCNLTVTNRGGNATTDVNAVAKGAFVWSPVTGCTTRLSSTIFSPFQTIVTRDTLRIVGLQDGEIVMLHALNGTLLSTQMAADEAVEFQHLLNGFYIVSSEFRNRKVALFR